MSDNALTRVPSAMANETATFDEIRSMFANDPESLRLLALLLTADETKADKCFVDGLKNCAEDNRDFQNWARAWAVRTIVRNAIEMVSPAPPRNDVAENEAQDHDGPSLRALVAAITGLCAFDRFVFVMSVLEGYPFSECCSLLGCTADEFEQAQSRALNAVAFVGESFITAITFAKACSSSMGLSALRTR